MEKKVTLPCFAFFLASLLSHAPASGAESTPVFEIERVNLTSAGAEFSESFSLGHPSVSADGRYVVFTSNNALVPGDTNARLDVYLRDRDLDTTSLVSLTSTGALATGGDSFNAKISADGTCVAFVSNATNLVPDKTGFLRDVYVRNLFAGTTTRVSVATGNVQGNADSGSTSVTRNDLSISDDGRYVAFRSTASNLVAGDTNGTIDVFRHDRSTGTTIRVSLTTAGAEAGWDCDSPAISGDGSRVAFVSRQDFGGNPANGIQVWLRDIGGAATELISRSDGGSAGNGSSHDPDLSFAGRYVVFESASSNLVGIAASGANIFVRDRQGGSTSLVSVTATGTAAGSSQIASITANGRFVAFGSFSNQIVLGDTNSQNDIFIRDLQTGRSGIASRTSVFLQSNGASHRPAIADGTLEVVFESAANNLVPGDTNETEDLFVGAPAFPSTVLINEVDAFTANGQTFIELYDGGTGNTDLTGLVIVLYDGATDTSYGAFDLDGFSTDGEGYFVIGTAAVPVVDLVAANGFLQSGVDAVALYYDNATTFPNSSPVTVNRLLDAVVHENNQSNDSGLLPLPQNTSQPQADEAANDRAATESVQRLPDGAGLPGVTGVFKAYTPSPGGPNGVPAALDLDELSDSGRSDSDDVTNDTTPTITGLAPVGSTVVLSSSLAGVVGSDTADAAGIWVITPTVALGEGTHLFTASADGGPSSAALSIVIDTTAPSAPAGLTLASSSDSGVSNSDRITNVITPTIEGTAENGSLVSLFSDLDGAIGSTGTTGNWSLVSDELGDGNHQFTATATDLAGNESIDSTTLNITIDTVPPGVVVARQVGQATPA
jgi:Tol biopolymer transport system component